VRLKPVYFLLGLGFAGSAAGLGLGELSVRSSLGQPLHATVNILDPGATITPECFSLAPSEGGIAPPLRAQLSLEQAGSQTLLHIRTPYSVNDPVAQFVLVTDCAERLQRDYVILLDPPAQITSPISRAVPAATAQSAPTAPVADTAPRTTLPQRRANRAPTPASSPSAPGSRQPAARGARAATADSAPRLVLSGKRHIAGAADAALVLRLDTNLPDLAHPHPGSLTATELSDENTALSRKLAHLESQLVALQRSNAELEARQVAAPAAAAPLPDQPAKWPLVLLIIGLLTGASTLAVWLRRRKREPFEVMADVWTRPYELEMPGTDLPATDPVTQAAEMPSAPERMPEIAQPILPESTEIKDDILDQAEVYMAHGHGELAIHLLQEHLRDAPGESPVPWLLLLDLLHREGNAENYAAASAECRRHFNVNLSGHPISQDSEIGLGLEAYPHLLDQLVSVWNSPDIDDFFKDLIYDHRGGTRMGFEPSAYRDILLLRAIAQDVLPLAA